MPNKRAARKHARKRAQAEFGSQARAWFPGKGKPLVVVPSKRYLLRQALEGRESLVLRKGGGQPTRVARLLPNKSHHAFELEASGRKPGLPESVRFDPLGNPDASMHARAVKETLLKRRVFKKGEYFVSPWAIRELVDALRAHGFLAEVPVFARGEAESVSYRAGHTLAELQAFPRRFARVATPATANKLAEMLALVWKNGFAFGHLHLGNILYFKGKVGLIDWAKLQVHSTTNYAWAPFYHPNNRLLGDLVSFTNVLRVFVNANPSSWPEPQRRFRAVWERLASNLPLSPAARERFVADVLTLEERPLPESWL